MPAGCLFANQRLGRAIRKDNATRHIENDQRVRQAVQQRKGGAASAQDG